MRAPTRAKPARPPKLSFLQVRRLFDQLDHDIPIRTEHGITAIIAPNGSGKTICLRIIAALYGNDWLYLQDLEFEEIVFHFDNGATIAVSPRRSRTEGERSLARRNRAAQLVEEDEAPGLDIVFEAPGRPRRTWSPKLHQDNVDTLLELYAPSLRRAGAHRWTNYRTRQNYTLSKILANYIPHGDRALAKEIWGHVPSDLDDLLGGVECRLIDTQRLVRGKPEPQPRYADDGEPVTTISAISTKAQSLRDILSAEMNRYATLSQSLDQTFPQRFIQRSERPGSSAIRLAQRTAIHERLAKLDEMRHELMVAGILDVGETEPISVDIQNIEGALAEVLQVYTEDTERKLSSLLPLLQKIKLFKELCEKRFLTKEIEVDKEHGLQVRSRGRPMDLDNLSSGEQHQLVLFFELLFEVPEDALILIDEPEISLHVAWQKRFIADLLEILKLNRFDVVMATHSPQLVSHWPEFIVDLAETDDHEYEDTDDPDVLASEGDL